VFSYRPPKGSCWGHALRPGDPAKAARGLQLFFETYFEVPGHVHDVELFWDRAHELSWKEAVLPNIDWAPPFLQPENERFKQVSFLVSLGQAGRISFPLGFLIPISVSDPGSYGFLRNLSRDAPFKFNVKHFSVVTPIGKKGNIAYRKAHGEMAVRIASAIEHD
jgi:hypothetical protein